MKILIVEDEITIRDILGETLKKWGHTIAKVEDFDNIFQIFVAENPQLVLLDINLPSFDGFYWCSKIRKVSKVPIIFISSRNTPMDMIMAMNMGGDDFIQKPFEMNVLMAKINALLRRSYSYIDTQTSVLEHDGVILNLKDWEVLYEDKKINLTKTEFAILQLLMQNNGSVVRRNKIIEMDQYDLFVQSDSKWLGFVTDQIIANSLKYTEENGKISVHFEEDSKEKRLIIQDNGIGIKQEDIDRVFEKGFTGSIGRSHAKSTGMGLYLAKQLALKLGHNISIESEEGIFTKVVIHFPKIRNYLNAVLA